ncbi:MAG: NAD(P)-dependent oxidoreductase [Gammaproteobacteria bacterium]|nr:NAD(P)-dependent oxidoreductase [Gammaproteobacteria bacterium]
MVADTPDILEVVTGENGVDKGARPGHIVVDMSTVSPTETRAVAQQLEAKGIAMLDAPVSGGETGAIDGTLSIMVGGPEEIFERVRPVFEVLGGQVRRIGDAGAGQVAKACNQLLVAQTMAAIAEAYLLAESSGVSREAVRDALLGGFAYGRILEVHGERMLTGDYQPGFKAELHLKDLRIVNREAQETGLTLSGAKDALHLMEQLGCTGRRRVGFRRLGENRASAIFERKLAPTLGRVVEAAEMNPAGHKNKSHIFYNISIEIFYLSI